ncbi:alkaline phosphatase, partial [Pseudidiomarina aestuarii]
RLLTDQQTEGQPFALMIEGSQIDWCGHANDIACAVHEMADFAAAIEVVKAFQAEHPNTLLVITADHSTGGLTLGQGGEYAWYSERVMGIQNSLAFLTEQLLGMPREQWREYLQPRLNLDFSDDDWQQLIEAELPESERARDKQYALGAVLVPLISKHTRTGWTTTGHTAVDVPVLAEGLYGEQLRGYQDHTDIAKVLLNIVK